MASEWSPIETAPRDGTQVLLHHEKLSVVRERTFVGRWDGYWSAWFSTPGAHQRAPTHWMPLPPAPGAA